MRAGDKWGLVSPFLSRIPLAADPACHLLPFSIVLTDREPGTGYVVIIIVTTSLKRILLQGLLGISDCYRLLSIISIDDNR